MNINALKKSLILLALFAILMTAFVSTAAAADTTLTVSNIGSSSLNLHENAVLQYDLDIHEAYASSYRLEITLKNTNSSETDTGFEFFDYTGKVYSALNPTLQSVIKNVTISPQPDGSTKLIYGLESPDTIRVDVTVRANGLKVYPEEEVIITAELFSGFASTTPMALVSPPSASNLEVVPFSGFSTEPIASSFRTVLISPPMFSGSPTEYQAEFNLSSSVLGDLYTSGGGMRLRDSVITFNLSNVMITSGGTIQSYSAWIDNDGTTPSPVKIYYGTTLLDSSNSYSFTTNMATYYPRSVANFKFVTTADFVSGDHIDFRNTIVGGTAYVNSRGPVISIGSTGSDVSVSVTGANYTPPAFSSMIRLLPPFVTSSDLHSGGTIQAYSEKYSSPSDPNHLLYYQDLVKFNLTSSVAGGENMTVRIDVPAGVTLTHIRMPSPTSTVPESKYESVSIVRGGIEYDLSMLYPSPSPVYHVTLADAGGPYTPGEDIVFKFTNLSNMNQIPSSSYSYSSDYLITLIGTTDNTVLDGATLTFFGSIDGGNPAGSSLILNVRDTYVTTSSHHGMTSFISRTSNYNTQVTTLNPGDQFYLYSRFLGTWYPYFSAHRTNIFDGAGTSVFSNPVFYFSVPNGFDFNLDHIVLTNSAGVPIGLKDASGNDLKLSAHVVTEFTDDVNNLYGVGSKLIEVKFEQVTPVSSTFWVGNGTTQQYYIQLPLTVSLDYSGPSSVTFKNETVLLSTWDPSARVMNTGGTAGTSINLDSIRGSEVLLGKEFGTYASSNLERTIAITTPLMARVSAGVQTPGGLQYYNPANTDSYLKLKAGSQNEKFTFSAVNYLSDSFPNAKTYFLLPHGDGWVPEVSGITITDFPADGDYHIFYSTDAVLDETFIGNADVDSFGDISGLTWTPFTVTDPTGSSGTPTIDGTGVPWSSIRAIKYEFGSFDNTERLSADISFDLPPLSAGPDYTVVGFGKTLFYFDSSRNGNSSSAPAIMLVESDKPIIKGYNTTTSAADEISSLPTSGNTTSPIPDWYNIFVYDDFTSVPLSEVKIVFTPTNISLSGDTHTLNTAAMLGTPVSYTPPSSEGVFAPGFQYTIPNHGNYINTTTPGSYVITYTTGADADFKSETKMRTLTISKDPATVSFTDGTADILYTDSVPSGGWNDYFKSSLASKTDLGTTIADSLIVFESTTPAFDSTVPGAYNFTYSYTDIGMNYFEANVTVTVKYITSVNVDVIANGVSVSGLTVLDSGNGITFSGTPYSASFTAPTTNPGSVTAAIDISSATIPAGINNTIANPLHTETFSLSNPPANPIEIHLTPISVEVVPAGFVNKIISVSMMDSSGVLVPGQDETGPFSATPISFAPITGWFAGGSYSFDAEVEPGYTFSGDFTRSITSYVSGDSAFTVANADVSQTLNVVESPLISGKVWADTNRNSIIDAGESAVSGVTVNIYNSSTNGLVVSVTTDTDGAYQVYNELASSDSYYVEIQMPTGFNTVSDLLNDQGIDSSFKSAVISTAPGSLHHTVNAGFYSVSGGGSGTGTGNATVRNPGGATVVENEPEVVTPPEPEVVTTPEPEQQPPQESGKTMSMSSLILALVAVVLGLVQVYSAAKLRSEKAENPNLVYQAIIIVAAIAAVIVFFLTNGIGGDIVLFSSNGLIIAAFVAIEIFLTAKIYLANR
jgi:hypothetical protein